MRIAQYYYEAKKNRWFRYFTTFCRIILALGFIPSGLVKIMGERFTSLSDNHPMGHYLEALYHTGYYYTSIGILQVTAAILLLIPRTALLGAIIYFPIILNICILSFAVRFDGSLFTSPLMVLTNVYLLCWDYDRLKYILPLHHFKKTKEVLNSKFPFAFFGSAVLILALIVFIILNLYDIRPRNTIRECQMQCKEDLNKEACEEFCDCIHDQGNPLDSCLHRYKDKK
jgi:uncharacterized membrane protein YphA (DoxX/SURF4 family)